MKRKLNEVELKLTKKGIENRTKQIVKAKESLEINLAAEQYIKVTREYEDKLRPYNRKVEDKNMEVKLEKLRSDIKIAESDLKNLKSQLKEGVETKNPAGVD